MGSGKGGPRKGWGAAQAQPHSRKRPRGSLPAEGQSCFGLRLLGVGSGLWTKGEQAAQPLLSLRERDGEKPEELTVWLLQDDGHLPAAQALGLWRWCRACQRCCLTVGFSLCRGRLSFCILASSGATVKNKNVFWHLSAWAGFPDAHPLEKVTLTPKRQKMLGRSPTSGTTGKAARVQGTHLPHVGSAP